MPESACEQHVARRMKLSKMDATERLGCKCHAVLAAASVDTMFPCKFAGTEWRWLKPWLMQGYFQIWSLEGESNVETRLRYPPIRRAQLTAIPFCD